MTDNNNRFRGLLQRPYEPTFVPKSDGQLYYDLPETYFTDRYRQFGASLTSRFGVNVTTRVPFPNIAEPDIAFADVVPHRAGFSIFNPAHRRASGQLIELFMNQKDAAALSAVAAYVRDRVNGPLFQYALSVALMHRADTRDVAIPSFLELFPDRFVDPAVLPQLREEGNLVEVGNRRSVDIPMNYTASERVLEQRLAYWREDIGVNLHHWHWHLVYPPTGPEQVVRKDRRGELFFYMHQQMQARYSIERFANGLPKVRSFANLRDTIEEGYFPKITRSSDGRSFPARLPNQHLSDVNRPEDSVVITIAQMDQLAARIFEAIDSGMAQAANGDRIPLDNFKGIDVLGDLLEASVLSVNPRLYGDFHHNGHYMLSYVHDPDNSYLEGYGVIGENTTAMRDPLFFRWHQHIDDIFQRHKQRLPTYTPAELSFSGISVDAVDVQLNRARAPSNVLLTFWQRSQVDLGIGVDFGPQGSLFATFTHIQHAPFSYRIRATNRNSTPKRGTVRIFLSPRNNELGEALPFRIRRLLIIEMDKFVVTLNPGENSIVRRSEQSSLTIPYERTFRNVTASTQAGSETFQFCNCGWPAHMLLPKGSPEGLDYDIFVMISDFTNDRVLDFDETVSCDDAHTYCGLRYRRYPDARSMGYPFDRFAMERSLEDFVRPYSNMRTSPVQIRFTNTVIART